MEIASYYAERPAENGRVLRVCYKTLATRRAGGICYGVRCYVAGSSHPGAQAEDCFGSEEAAEFATARLACEGVFPQHLAEVLGENGY